MSKLFDVSDFPRLAESKGLIEGMSSINLTGVGFNLQVDTEVDLVCDGVVGYIFPSDVGESMEVFATNVSDAGKKVIFFLLDDQFTDLGEVTVTLDTVPVVLPGVYSRCNGGRNSGSSKLLGEVHLRQSGGGDIFACINTTSQRAWQGVYTMPSNKEGFASYLVGSMKKSTGSSTDVTLVVSARKFGEVFIDDFRFGLQRSGSTVKQLVELNPDRIHPKMDLKFSAISSASGADVLMRLGIDIFEVKTNVVS